MPRFRALVRTLVFALLFSARLAFAQETAAKRVFDVPAQGAESALKLFSDQSSRAVIMNSTLVQSVRTNQVKGEFTPGDALRRLLAGTGLVATQDSKSGAFVVHRETPTPNSPRATVAPATTHRPETSPPAADETIHLSPFEVSTDKDDGYVATSTLAGSRLNSELMDTPAAISVFTKEFLDDIAVVDVNEAIEYGLNSVTEYERTGNLVAETNFQFRIRGISGAQRARNYFRSQLNSDMYNIERIDFARGPNSILFGEASPAGLVNTSTKFARLGRNSHQAQLRVGSYDMRRATLDVNRKLGSNAAVRVNLLRQDAEGYREFEFVDKKGAALAGTWRPFKKTQLKFEVEKLDIEENRARPWTGWDQYTYWESQGEPVVGSPTQWGTGGATGVTRAGNNTMLFFNNGPLAGRTLYTGTTGTGAAEHFRVSLGPINVPGLDNPTNTLDFSRHPRDGNLAGAGARSNSDSLSGGIFIEQQVGDDFVFEFAGATEYEKRLWDNPVNFGALQVRYDANGYLPQYNAAGVQTGIVPNPNQRQLVVIGNRTSRYNEFFREQYRATASYHLDFNKLFREKGRLADILGHHHLAVLYSSESFESERQDRREVNVSPNRLNSGSVFSGQNVIQRASYVNMFSSNRAERGAADGNLTPIDNVPLSGTSASINQVAGKRVDAEMAMAQWTWTKNEIDTRLFASHSYFLKDRLVVLFGVRKDKTKGFSSDNVIDPNTEIRTGFIRRAAPDRVNSGDTMTRGLVGHVLPWLSLYYNEADNFGQQDVVRLFGLVDQGPFAGNRVGEGKDAGVKLRLFSGKVHASLGWYETADSNQLSAVSGNYRGYVDRLWASLNLANPAQYPLIEVDGRDTRSLVSKGYEFEVTANPVRQLRLSFNLKHSETTNDNLLPNVSAYIVANRATWVANTNLPLTSSINGAETVGELLTLLDNQVLFDSAAAGQAPVSDRKMMANITANYTFDSGFLKDVGIGGATQYRGKSVIGYRALTDNGAVYAPSFTMANAWLSYSRRLSDKIRMRLQFNIDNLFDFQDPQPIASGQFVGTSERPPALVDGLGYLFSLPVPRRYSFTATFSF